jgi:hypothetical protein
MDYYQRNLPHWQPEGKRIFLTWRLYGSLPAVFLSNLHKNTSLEPGKKFLSLDGQLDCAGFGPVWLKETQIAQAVVNAIGSVANQGWCIVFAYVVMPNHVHLLLEPKTELRLVMRAIKGPTARVCNEFLGQVNRFGNKNRTTIGCAIPPPLNESGATLKIILYPPGWSNLPNAGNGRAPTGSIGFSLCSEGVALRKQQSLKSETVWETSRRHRLKPMLQARHG